MAKRKKTSSRKSVARSAAPGVPALTIEDWEKELTGSARDASATAAGVGGGALFINTRGGNLSFQSEPLPQPLPVFVLDQIRENNYYEGDFDPENPRAPICFAIGRVEEELAPPEDLETKRAERCAMCEKNRFGSADRGRGKACKNILRLALLPAADLDLATLAKAEPAFVRVPTTSVKNFRKHANFVEKGLGRPLFSVVTELSTEDDPKNVWRMNFAPTDPPQLAEAEEGAVLLQRRKDVQEDLERPPPPGDADETPKAALPKARRKVVSRKAGKKKR